MRTLPYFVLCFLFTLAFAKGQSAQAYFNTGANHYLQDDTQQAQQVVNEGLKKYPNSAPLQKLKKLLQQKNNQKNQAKQNQSPKPNNAPNKPQPNQQNPKQENAQNNSSGTPNPNQKGNAQGNVNQANNQQAAAGAGNKNYDQILKAIEEQESKSLKKVINRNTHPSTKVIEKDW